MKETTAHQDEAEHAAQAAQTGQTQDGTWYAVITYGAGALEGFGKSEDEARAHAGRKLTHLLEGGPGDAEVA